MSKRGNEGPTNDDIFLEEKEEKEESVIFEDHMRSR